MLSSHKVAAAKSKRDLNLFIPRYNEFVNLLSGTHMRATWVYNEIEQFEINIPDPRTGIKDLVKS
jgi:hypothetical protein